MPTTTTTPPAKVKVRCSQVRVCGWSGERKTQVYAPITFTFTSGRREVEPRWLDVDPTEKPCPQCLRRSVELVVRTPNPNPTLVALVALARAGLTEER